MSRILLSNLISEFGAVIGIPDLSLDEEGECFLQLDAKMIIAIRHVADTDNFALLAQAGHYESANEQALYRDLLEANYLWLGAGGATLSVRSEDRTVFLAYQTNLHPLDIHSFQKIIEGFVNNLEFWMNRLDTFQDDRPEPMPSTLDMNLFNMRA